MIIHWQCKGIGISDIFLATGASQITETRVRGERRTIGPTPKTQWIILTRQINSLPTRSVDTLLRRLQKQSGFFWLSFSHLPEWHPPARAPFCHIYNWLIPLRPIYCQSLTATLSDPRWFVLIKFNYTFFVCSMPPRDYNLPISTPTNQQ